MEGGGGVNREARESMEDGGVNRGKTWRLWE